VQVDGPCWSHLVWPRLRDGGQHGACTCRRRLLAQAAQAMKERPLLDLAQDCHPQTLRQMRWANAHLKSTSPQVIAS
jgi:hypothetical protein